MKKPKPRDFGLDSDHPGDAYRLLDADPAQPYTQEELTRALDSLLFERALQFRRGRYADAVHEYDYNNGGR